MGERPSLGLAQFVDIGTLKYKDWLSDNVFDFLGKPLEKFIMQVLERHGASVKPVIEGEVSEGAYIEGAVFIARGAKVEPTAYIKGPCYIGAGTEVRHGAYIRGNVFVGERCVVGHTTEVKGSIFFDNATAGHFAYIGDSILGRHVNLGAGTKLANLKLKGDTVRYQDPGGYVLRDSGLRKFGAVLGDHVQTGCNSVISPGSLLFPQTFVLPCAHFRGTLPR